MGSQLEHFASRNTEMAAENAGLLARVETMSAQMATMSAQMATVLAARLEDPPAMQGMQPVCWCRMFAYFANTSVCSRSLRHKGFSSVEESFLAQPWRW